MQFFREVKTLKLRSHLNKYLVADEDGETVWQSRNSSSRRAIWVVEQVEGKTNAITLKSYSDGKYLTATNAAFLLGMTGNKVLLTNPDKLPDWNIQWDPIQDGFLLKLRAWCGTYLRANGGTPPWRNSITHDEPHTSSTRNWVLWGVIKVEDYELAEIENNHEVFGSRASFSSMASSDELDRTGSEPGSPMITKSPRFSLKQMGSHLGSPLRAAVAKSPKWSQNQVAAVSSTTLRSGMDFFLNAKAVRLRGNHDKYLLADEDEETVTQDRNGSAKTARWTVEFVPGSENIIRLKSCFGRYLTASNQPFLLGMTGRKVLQTLPRRLDSSVEWEPNREGNRVKLKTRYGNFLRANGGVPPWRNSVTHDIPHRTVTQDWVVWDVDVLEIHVRSPDRKSEPPQPLSHQDSLNFGSSPPSPVSVTPGHFSRQESSESTVSSPPKLEGRIIYYHVADENGEVDDTVEGSSFTFKGNAVEELTRKLEEETGLQGILVCTRSPLNRKLYPLRLQLPPNNANMQVVVVLNSSKG